ncbi:AMP-binding protein [Chromobacterium subtsugae]|uniref:AMP-binding protein n=1 Tax=Chromobacterium subtsugae TaxID=251747 RepID=UPI000641243D|nr:AMP-binding protein [Chromobacterium subtsugae]
MDALTFELSRSQQAVFTMEAFHLSGRPFFLGGVARLSGQVSLESLARAGAAVRDAQDAFRIGFVADGEGAAWHGVRHARPQSAVESMDFSRHPDPEQAFAGWARRQLLLDEDLAQTPIKIFAVRFDPERSGWFVKAHHAAADGAALALVMEHLANALEDGGRAPAPLASPAFSVIADGERAYEGSRRRERDGEYWRGSFAETAPPASRRSPIGDYRGAEALSRRVRLALSDADNARLRRFKNGGGSVFRLFFAAVAHAQMAVEDGDGVLLQAPMLNRWSQEDKRTVAMAVAPVLVPVLRSDGPAVADSYRALEKRLLKAVAHSRYAPGIRWGEFATPQWQRIVPAFGVSYQTGVFQASVSGAQVEIDHLQAVEALFATIHIHDRFDGGQFKLEADFRQQWSAAQCRAFLQTVADYALEAAAQLLGEPADGADAVPALPIGVHLREAFARHADRCLFKPGDGGEALSYGQGLRWIRRFSAELRRRRDAGRPVLILGRRAPETTLAYLACLMAGVTVVPVCPSTPSARLLTIARNSGAGLCVHAEADLALARTLGLPLLLAAREPDGWPAAEALPDAPASGDPAYILYTSGSTGEPKGVAISPEALACYALAATADYAAERPFSAPLFTSFGFDLTQTSILAPVLSGGFIQTREADIREQPALLQALLADEELTGVKCTPSHLALLAEHSPPRRGPLTFVVGGENLSMALVSQALAVFPPGSRVINEYGPTEATVGCCVHSVDRAAAAELEAGAIMPIGAALGMARMSIRDAWGQRVPQGFQGEIWIGGPVLADGYVGNPAQTEAKFVSGGDGRWYRTGDLGLSDEQGVLHCLGRIDDEFKVRGHRIHPAEIEQAVEGALARVGGLTRGGKLKALKLSANGRETVALCSSEALPAGDPAFLACLREKLPDAWLPGLYCAVAPWPVNANGKVDAAALIAAAEAQLAASDEAARAAGEPAPRDYALPDWLDEAFLAPIWPQRARLEASFLEQGGDSIKAIRLAALLAKQGVRVGAAELLAAEPLGAVLENACAGASRFAEAGAEEAAQADWIGHLPGARWFRGQGFRHGDRLQQGIVLRLQPSLAPERVDAAVAAVQSRHAIFALRMGPDAGACRFAAEAAPATGVHALSAGESLQDRLLKLQEAVSLETRPSVHQVVLDPASGDSHLIWICHHLLCDVHSWIYLLDELDQALAADAPSAGDAPPEEGAFLWGRWLRDHGAAAPERRAEPAAPARAPVSAALAASGADIREMERRFKAERGALIAAALLETIQEQDMLPARPVALFENHGRCFAEAETPAGWAAQLAGAVGWFTGFNHLSLGQPQPRPHGFLRELKARLHERGQDWRGQLGLAGGGERPTVCVNDIGAGLGGDGAWRHFQLLAELSGGFRHPEEASVADFDLLIRDCRESGSVFIELRLGLPGAGQEDARRWLAALDARLSAWRAAPQDGELRPEAALLPSDFPLCRLEQAELDLIIHGVSA